MLLLATADGRNFIFQIPGVKDIIWELQFDFDGAIQIDICQKKNSEKFSNNSEKIPG